MNRCTRCLMPDTRPDSHFVDGVCSGCIEFDARANVDWAERRSTLQRLASGSHSTYDCVVPVSGGKDSTYQTITLLEMGFRVLCVAAATDLQSDIGRRNLDNLKRYADVIEVTPNIEVRKKLVRAGLDLVGDMSYPEHLAIWAIPTRVATQMGIPYVIWGENPQREYAAPGTTPMPKRLDADWVAEFGGMLGLRLDDLIGREGLTAADLSIYRFPLEPDVQGIWMGDYLPWDGWKNAFVAQQYGWQCLPGPVEGSLACYENLDNHVTVLRDWLRYCKYGYGRATDIASTHIRRGRLTRDEGLRFIAKAERFPKTSLGMPIEEMLAYFDLTFVDWINACMTWTNREIFDVLGDGTPVFRDARKTNHPDPAGA